jgi:hypothetical protein
VVQHGWIWQLELFPAARVPGGDWNLQQVCENCLSAKFLLLQVHSSSQHQSSGECKQQEQYNFILKETEKQYPHFLKMK